MSFTTLVAPLRMWDFGRECVRVPEGNDDPSNVVRIPYEMFSHFRFGEGSLAEARNRLDCFSSPYVNPSLDDIFSIPLSRSSRSSFFGKNLFVSRYIDSPMTK